MAAEIIDLVAYRHARAEEADVAPPCPAPTGLLRLAAAMRDLGAAMRDLRAITREHPDGHPFKGNGIE